MKLLCLVGLSGSGKTTVRNIFEECHHVQTFYTRELVGGEALVKNDLATDMRQHGVVGGSHAFISLCFTRMARQIRDDTKLVVFDSVRSVDEYDFMCSQDFFSLVRLVHISLDEEERKRRLLERDGMMTIDRIKQRDLIEMDDTAGVGFNYRALTKRSDVEIKNGGSVAILRDTVKRIAYD